MIFSCGENWRARKVRLENWHDFFPLVPRTVAVEGGEDICAWLQTIERRGRYCGGIPYSCWIWEYRVKHSTNAAVKRSKNILCRAWGHDVDRDALYYYNVAYCGRCACEVNEDCGAREWLKVRLWRCREAIREAWERAVWRFRSCPDCGRRFGRHDDSVDHTPF